jgi:hypothetical protein
MDRYRDPCTTEKAMKQSVFDAIAQPCGKLLCESGPQAEMTAAPANGPARHARKRSK